MKTILVILLLFLSSAFAQVEKNVWEYKTPSQKWTNWVNKTPSAAGYYLLNTSAAGSDFSKGYRLVDRNNKQFRGLFIIYTRIDTLVDHSSLDSVEYKYSIFNGSHWIDRGVITWDRLVPGSQAPADSNITWITSKHSGQELFWHNKVEIDSSMVFYNIRLERVKGKGATYLKEYQTIKSF